MFWEKKFILKITTQPNSVPLMTRLRETPKQVPCRLKTKLLSCANEADKPDLRELSHSLPSRQFFLTSVEARTTEGHVEPGRPLPLPLHKSNPFHRQHLPRCQIEVAVSAKYEQKLEWTV